jgi:ribosomal protein S18 acetylase RimI-like enzyme
VSEGDARGDVIVIKGPEGALSLELMTLREGVARGFLRQSPRSLKLSAESSKCLSEELIERKLSKILLQDNRKRLLSKVLTEEGWVVQKAVDSRLPRQCNMVTTYDIPIDETLMDDKGGKPNLTGTSNMSGICANLGDRQAWAFYTDDGETARIVSEGERRQGLLIASRTDDMFEAAECLVRFLVTANKSWAVFSTDLGRFIRQYDPTTMWRLVSDRPRGYEHSAEPVSSENKKAALSLFSEYYDESRLQSMLRLRKFLSEKWRSIFLVDGGFVIARIEGDTGLIYDIYVTPARQGEGLGGELMRAALTSLSGRVSSVYLHTSYPRAKALYEKFGFRTTYSQLAIRLDEIAITPPSR